MSKIYKNPETIGLHAGWRKDENTNSVAVPIHQTTSYQFDDCDHAANLFALSELGNIYTRIMNPTVAVLEDRVSAIEGGVGALGVASGLAASAYAIQNLCKSGDNFISSTHLYGGTYNQFKNTFASMGIEVRFVDPSDPQNFLDAVDEKTRAFFGETVPNPKLKVFPIEEVASIGRELGIPLIIDNTVSPLTCRPIEHGAAIVIHSLTKYIGGHGNSIGGIIVDSGNFDWTANPGRQPLFNQPDESYHGAVWGQLVPEALGAPIAFAVRARVVLLRDLGSAVSPMNSFNIIQGLETLPLRFKAHQENAEKLANYLLKHKAVQQVIYPSLFEGKDKTTADKYLKTGYGPIVGMVLRGGADAGKEFIDNLKMVYHVANIGDTRTLAIHPSSTTNSQLSLQDQFKAGVTPGYIRLAVGIEHIDDIISDIDQALQIADKK